MKQLIEDYKRRIKTIENDLRLYKSTGSINDIKKVERLTTKLFEYRAFVTELERALSNKQNILNDLNDLALYRKENVQVDNSDDLGREDKTNSPDNNNTNSIVQVNFPDFIARVDFSTLRTQKKSLIEMIDDMEKKNAEYYYNELSDLNGILNLIDSIQDFACDVMGMNPIDIFDFELEEGREDVIKPEDVTKLTYSVITDDVINNIIERKKQGIDCTEKESAEIKGWLRELKLPEEQAIIAEIQLLFPQEYDEYLNEEEDQNGYL
jgi:hypothetical protein